MKDNEYYKPIDEKKSVSDEKLTLEDQVTTILKKKFDFRLKNKNKKKKNTLNQSTALVMSSVAVVMVTTAAFPTTATQSVPLGHSLIGEWENENGIYLSIDDSINLTFSSDAVGYDFTITSVSGSSDGTSVEAFTSFSDEHGEIMANYYAQYNDEQTILDEENIPLSATRVDEGVLIDFDVLSPEPILFTPRVYNYGGFVPEFYGELWLSESSNKQILFDFLSSDILYYDGGYDGIIFSQDVVFDANEVTAHTEVFEYSPTNGNMYREPSLDHYFTGDYIDDNGKMQVDIILHGELVIDNEVFYKADMLYDDYYWNEIYNIIWPSETEEYTPSTDEIPEPTPEPTQTPTETYGILGVWESETGIYLEFDKDNSLEFSSDLIADSFTIYDNGNVSMHSVPNTAETYTNFNEVYGEIMKNYATEYGDSQIISSSEDIPIIITGVEEGIIVDFKVISPEPLLFTNTVYDYIYSPSSPEATSKTFSWYSDDSELNPIRATVTYEVEYTQIWIFSSTGFFEKDVYIFTEPGSSLGGVHEIFYADPRYGRGIDIPSAIITDTDFGFNLQIISTTGEVLENFDFVG